MSDAKIIKFARDSVIIKEGEANPDMYKIVQGNAELYTGYGTDEERLLGIIGPHACFGEFGMLIQVPSIYTVVAYSDVYAMKVTAGEIGDFVQQNHKNIIDIMKNMARTMMIMQKQINLMSGELTKIGNVDPGFIKETQRNLRGYAVYNPDNPKYLVMEKYNGFDISL
ncbi:MAG: Crp/Fnr family transcriptional regulator [Lachnospiraceae bacterium]|nr:Crp/Fnr family transcriptional regulator [Lachnospiraceae bacterium]